MKKTIKYLQDGEYHYATVKDVGDIDLLKTKTKDDLVGAINELVTDGITVNEDKLNEVVDKINNTQQQIGQTIEQAKANSEGLSDAQKEVIAIRTQVAEQYQEALKNFKEAQDKLDEFKQQAAKDLADATDELRKQTLTDIAQAQAANIKELSDNLKVIQDNLNATTVDLAKLRTQLSDMSDIGQVKVDIQNLQDSLATKVSSKELDELATRVTQNETDVRQTKDELSSKATKNELDLATQRVSAAESKIQQNADNINLTVKKAELNDSLEQYNEGRENRLRDTRDFGKSWSLQGSDIGDDHPFDPQHNVKTVMIKPGDGISQTTDLTDDDLGNPFLLSMWVKQGVVPVVTYGSVTLPTPQVTETKNGYERKVFKFTPDKAGQVLTIKSGNNTTAMVMGEPKLEQGYFPTAYTPNSNDDYQSTVSLTSSLSVQADKIEATVEKQSRSDGEIEGLKSRVTQTENGIELANQNLKHTADGLTQQFEGKLSATAQSLTTEYDRKTDEKIGQITDSGENLILNSAFTNDKDRLAHWQNVSNWVHVNQDSNQLNWAVIDRSGLSSDSPVSLESNYFNVQKGKITVAVDIQSSDTSRLDNDSILVLSMYNSSYSRVDFRELTLNDLGLTKAILQDRATHRGMYRYGLDRSDVTYMTVKAQVKRNGLIKFTNFSAKASSIDNGGYTRNANDDQEQIINQNTKIEQNSSSISLKANQVDVTRAVSDSETRSTGKISEAENRINTTINNTKSQLENRIVEEKNAAIKVASDSIDSSVSRITRDFNDKFDNLRISNLNLLYDTDPSEVRGYNVASRYRWFTASGGNGYATIENATGDSDQALYAKHFFVIRGNTSGNKDVEQVVSLSSGTYTLSFKTRLDRQTNATSTTGQVRTWDRNSGQQLSGNTFTVNSHDWVDQSVTFTINGDHLGSPYNPYGNAVDVQMGITGYGSINYAEPMLVKGGTPVEWGANPGDVDSNPNLLTTDVANLIIDDSANTGTRGNKYYTAYSELKEDTYYTVSYSATGSKLENNLFDIGAYDLDGSVAYSYESAVADGQRRSVVLRTGKKKNPNDKISLLLYAGKSGKTQGKTVFVKDLTLTEGTAPHAYSPSVADTATNGQVTSWIKKSESDWKVKADEISGRVTTVENNVKTNESRLSQAQLSLMDDHFSTTVEQVRSTSDKLNNLSVGGTNLLMGTRNFDSKYWYSSDTNLGLVPRSDDSTSTYIHAWADWASYKNKQTITLDPNKDYIISADIAIYGGDGSGLLVTAYGTLDGKDRALSNDYKVSNVTHLSDGFTRISLPFVCHGKTLTTFRIEGHGNWSTAAGSVYISHIKLEEGNRATAWSPSFDELATNDNLNSQIQATQTKIDQTAESIRMDVKNTDGRLSTLEQTANGISSTVTNLTNAVNGIQIGGTNLLKGTSSDWREFTVAGWMNATTTSQRYPNISKYPVGTYFTYSAYVKNTSGQPVTLELYPLNSSGSRIPSSAHGNVLQNGQTDYLTVTIQRQSNDVAMLEASVISTNGQVASNSKISIMSEKLEVGNRATAWSPAPEDVDSSIASVSSKIDQTASSIRSEVSSNTGKISQLQQTANGISSTVTNLTNTVNSNNSSNQAGIKAANDALNAMKSSGGSRNFFVGSETEKIYSGYGTNNNQNNFVVLRLWNFGDTLSNLGFNENDDFTVRVPYDVLGSTNQFQIRLEFYTETGYVGATHVDSMKGSGVFQHTGKITSTMLNATMMRVRIDGWNPWIAFKQGVLEKGTVAHDWTPSVEELRESAQGIERNLLVGTSPNWRSVATDSNDNQWWHLSTANSYSKIPISQFSDGTQFTYSVEVNNTTDHSVAPESFWLNSNGGRIRGAFTATLPILGPNSSRKYWAITDGKPSDAAYIEVDVISTDASTKGGQWISMRNEMLEVGTYAHAWTTSSGDHSGNLLIGTSDFSNPGSGKPNLDSAWVNLNSWSEVPNQKSPQNTKMYYRQNAWTGASERYWALTGTYTFSAYVHLGYLNNTGWTNGHKAALYIGDYSGRNASEAAILDKASMTISDVLTPYSWATVSLAFEVRKPGWIAPRIELLQDGSAIIISSYKLEKGLINNPEYSESSTTLISQIQQNADGISTKVAKGDVISTINQSAESVRINAGKINIDGNTDISGTLNVKNVILQGNSGKVDLTGGSIDIDSNDGSHGVSINPLFVQIGKGDFYTRVYDAGQLFYSKNDTNRITSMAQIGPSRFGTIATDPNLRGVTLTAVPTNQNKDSNYEGGNYISLGYQDPAKEAGHITNQLYVTWRDLHYTPTGGKDGLIAKGVHIADQLTFDEGISKVNFSSLLFKGKGTQDPLMITGWKFSDSAQSGYYQPTLLAGYDGSVHGDSMISFLWNSVKVIGTLDLSGVKIRSNGVDWTPTVGWVSWSVWHNVPHFAIYGGSGSNTAGYAMSADGAPVVFGRGALAGWQGNGWVRV